jgi:hypothetical protein
MLIRCLVKYSSEMTSDDGFVTVLGWFHGGFNGNEGRQAELTKHRSTNRVNSVQGLPCLGLAGLLPLLSGVAPRFLDTHPPEDLRSSRQRQERAKREKNYQVRDSDPREKPAPGPR